MARVLSVTLPVKLTNGNDGRGSKWFRSDRRRKQLVKQLEPFKRSPFAGPVSIVVTRVLGKGERLWDADSCGRGNAKEIIDSLVELGWFHDDGPKFIRHCDYRQCDKQRERGPVTQIEVFDDGENQRHTENSQAAGG